jgi:3-hydroxyisobutyrate dehydrogenase
VPDIAFVGLGRMGAPMCAALVRAGYTVAATDKRAEREPVAIACGASWRATPAQAASAAGVLISMLPGAREVRAAMLGETGALTSLAAGTAWIDMTSNSPVAVRPVRERAMKQGVEVLEAPVGGGIAAAREGSLQLFVGGEASVVERHRAVLEALGDPGGSCSSAGTAPGIPSSCW